MKLLPVITSITPNVGSLIGGAKVTIEGDAFWSGITSISFSDALTTTTNAPSTLSNANNSTNAPDSNSNSSSADNSTLSSTNSTDLSNDNSTNNSSSVDASSADLSSNSSAVSRLLSAAGLSIDPTTIQISYDKITFLTPKWNGVDNLIINLNLGGQSVDCFDPNDCSFTFDSAYISNVTTVSPSSVSQPNATITIDGIGFGNDTSKVQVKIGDQNCKATQVQDTQISCIVAGVAVGPQDVHVWTGNKYKKLF